MTDIPDTVELVMFSPPPVRIYTRYRKDDGVVQLQNCVNKTGDNNRASSCYFFSLAITRQTKQDVLTKLTNCSPSAFASCTSWSTSR